VTCDSPQAPVRPTRSPIELALRAAAGQFDGEVLAWVSGAFQAHVRAAGAVALEACLRLPATSRAYRLAARNACLIKAAKRVRAITPWQRATGLHEACMSFERRFVAWQPIGYAPSHASGIERDLFDAFRWARPPRSIEGLHAILIDAES
jgi:hypothetical protein